ncbi:amidohydrolase family protein [Candidatus Woesearchaeota archaeon]|jgi:5-methylthioadenosine/S-adenosylhomocysteine deaminase|nr:amidohydrolase family protein [Candidatus Woesearchaeota archaeon]MBT4368216.1 amidohydrolase family protein [Candidatus Woesearchaeota archaeon]MBT4712705.1 amidohydrolase family protein [Candidatus Woesearchaeota archaeon]MBT6639617.1 amidohydrolase family protein [Candidatus Woesearchaeota archaeon]MBT7133789.1 amidohydrolase family protein [Candidatus Woesearchaeota archaeon]
MTYLIKNATYIDENNQLVNSDIRIEKGKIKKLGKLSQTKTDQVINGEKYLISPSFVNAHFHLGETIYRGFAPRDSLKAYLSYTESVASSEEKVHTTISQLSIAESIETGTSTISCARGWKAMKKTPLRGLLSYPLMKSKKLIKYYKNDLFEETLQNEEVLTKNKTQKVKVGLWIHSLDKIDEERLKQVSKILTKNKKIMLTIHVGETKKQMQRTINKTHLTEIELLDKYGLIRAQTNLVHLNHCSLKDLTTIANKKANVTLCPTSNACLNTGLPDISTMQKKGINICIGTDGLATNDSASLLEACKFTFLLNRSANISPKALFNMITKNPAKTLGFNNGVIKEGKYADLNFFEINKPNLHPIKNVLSNLIFAGPHIPSKRMIDGEFVFTKTKNIISNFEELVQ